MGAKTEKQVKEERRQRAEAVMKGLRLNPDFQKEKLEKAAQYALKKYGKFFPPGESLNNPDDLLTWLNGHNLEFWTEFMNRSPEGLELQLKYGLSIPLTFEQLLQMPEDMADWPAHTLLKDGGKAVSLLGLKDDHYLTIRIDLSQPSTMINAEVRAMIQELKLTKSFAQPSAFPNDLEFQVYELYKKGLKPKQIITELEDKLKYLEYERGRKEFIKRSILKVEAWIKEVSSQSRQSLPLPK
jgi:hypothetical protein